MSKAGRNERIGAMNDRMRAATTDLRHHYRVRNILLAVVGIEACVFFVLRAWNAF